jgi:hypothetical protein
MWLSPLKAEETRRLLADLGRGQQQLLSKQGELLRAIEANDEARTAALRTEVEGMTLVVIAMIEKVQEAFRPVGGGD